jgi:hypothetical protein
MKGRPSWLSAFRGIAPLALAASLSLASPARAGENGEPPPAEAQEFDLERATSSFRSFATSWMAQLVRDADGQRNRFLSSKPRERLTYRRYTDSFETHLRETGRAGTPYVGILTYVEHVYSCTGEKLSSCRLLDSAAIEELFPFTNGGWRY